jgi:propionyl-CoA carboxylase alpha chain
MVFVPPCLTRRPRACSRRRRAVRLGDSEITLEITREGETLAVRFEGAGKSRRSVLASAWKPGDPIWSGTIDDRPFSVKVHPVLNGFDLAHRGIETRAYVYTEREARAARLMPEKKAADSGKAVRCPMPGLVVSISVVEGQEVKAGETLAVVEAMKMENVLRAERDGVVKAIKAKPGDSLAVDAVIMEFR